MVLLALILCQTPRDAIQPEVLGRLRSTFGEPKVDRRSDPDGDAFFYSMSAGSTRMLFPAGKADQRYYYTPRGGPGVLVLQTKTGGKVKLEWIAQLRPSVRKLPETAGTLERFLADRELEVAPPVKPAVKKALAAVTPYAMYYVSIPAGRFYYEFVRSDGANVSTRSVELAGSVPNTAYDYPISPEEREFIGR